MVPELFEVIAQRQELLALLGCELWSQSASLFQCFQQMGESASRSKLTLTALKRCIRAQFVHSDLKGICTSFKKTSMPKSAEGWTNSGEKPRSNGTLPSELSRLGVSLPALVPATLAIQSVKWPPQTLAVRCYDTLR
jgi:hypothetical protein